MNLFKDIPGYTIAARIDAAIHRFGAWWLDEKKQTNSLKVNAVLLAAIFAVHFVARMKGM